MSINSNKYYSQLIPEKVFKELDSICQVIEPNIKGFNTDCLCEVISVIACHTRKDNEPTPLRINYIKKLVPQGDKYLRAIMELGIVERSGKYIPGQTSYKYDFAPYYHSKYISRPLNDVKLFRRVNKVWNEIRKDEKKTTRGKSEQIKFLKDLEIEPTWREYVETITDIEKYNAVTASATRIENGDLFYSIDNTSGRFHSNVTNMKKDLRPHLRVKGQQLLNLDVKNSQPYLSTIILTNPGKASTLTNNRAFAMLLQSLNVSHNEDVKKYIQLVVYGQLYEYLQKEFNLSRDETKRQVLRILFARNRTPKNELNKKCRAIFREHFPTVHKIFSKVRGSEKGDKFTSFKRFAILLQRIEAYLMLEIILKRISKELPGVIAITIHDSIMTGILTNNVQAVRKIIEEELTDFVGFRPQIKIEGLKGIEGEDKILIQYGATTAVCVN